MSRPSMKALRRVADWETALAEYLLAAKDRPYAYGEHDCLLHCAAAVQAMTGKDLGRKHRGKYRSDATAVRHLRRHGANSPEEFLDQILPERPVAFARRGDIVLVDAIPGVCIGHSAVLVGDEGLIHHPRETWSKAWSVGE